MSDKKMGRDCCVVTIPSDFYEGIFELLDNRDFLLDIFEGNGWAINDFMLGIKNKAQELSGQDVCDIWVLAKEIDYVAFFLHPKNNSTQYKVNCNQETISKYYRFGAGHERDDQGCITVDNKMFGLMVTLAVFDTYGNSEDKDIIAAYTDSAQHINNSINETAESFTVKPSLDFEAFDKAMTIMSNHFGAKYDSSDYH